jgi:hypothetical protein
MLQAFQELSECVESDDEVRDLMNSLISELVSVADGNLSTAEQMIFSVLTTRPIDFSAFEQHPIKRVIELHNQNYKRNNYCGLLKTLVLFYPLVTDIPFTVLCNLVKEPEWLALLEKFNIPCTVQLGQIGYYFYSMNVLQIATVSRADRYRCCDILSILMLSPIRDKRKEVLNPLVALLLNNFHSCDIGNTPTLYQPSDKLLERLCHKIMKDITGAIV